MTSACMRRHGFRYLPDEVSSRQKDASGDMHLVRRLTIEEAEKFGYGDRLRRSAGADPDEAQQEYLQTLSESERRRYAVTLDAPESGVTTLDTPTGVITAANDGCVAEARKQIYGSVLTFLRIAEFPNALMLAARDADNANNVRRAVGVYAACMRDDGYDIATPKQAISMARAWLVTDPTGGISEAERALAVSDARCQEASRFPDELEAAIVTRAGKWIREHEAEIHELARLQQAARTRAATLNAGQTR